MLNINAIINNYANIFQTVVYILRVVFGYAGALSETTK